MLLSIQYLRGMAAILVLFAHMAYLLNGVYAKKDLGDFLFGQLSFGVDLFFVISGFVICLSTEKNESKRCLKYTIRRLFRLYPLLITCVAIYGVIAHSMHLNKFGEPTRYNTIKSMIPLHIDYTSPPPFFGYNILPPAWTLSYEVAFYVIFLAGLFISHRHRVLISSLTIIFLMTIIQISLSGNFSVSVYREFAYPEGIIRPIVAITSSPMLADFLYGMVAFAIHRNFTISQCFLSRITLLSIFFFSLLILFSGVMIPDGYSGPSFKIFHGPLNWGLIAFIMAISLSLYEKTFGIPFIKTLYTIGDISYSIYLTQWIWFRVLFGMDLFKVMHGLPKFSLAAILIVGFSFISYLFIERPFVSAARWLIKNFLNDKHDLKRS